MREPATLKLRARIVLPVAAPPIKDGLVEISAGRVVSISQWDRRHSVDDVTELGEVILLPGLVNAHCHLDYTTMAGKLAPPKDFPDWIKAILALKAHYSYSDYADSWVSGARMLLESGTTSVADIEAVPELLAEALPATPLKVFTFFEMTGVKSGRSGDQIVRDSLAMLDRLDDRYRSRAGLSPHSPYSTHSDLLKACAIASHDRKLRITMHLSESEPEVRMFRDATGPFYDWLKAQRNMNDCGGVTPVELAERAGLLNERFLAVHANYLSDRDIEILARSGASVVHCPSSHDYFGHAPFPFAKLSAAGVNVCVGTDSLASTMQRRGERAELSMFREMQLFARKNPSSAPERILELATMNGSRALGQLGGIQLGAAADLIAIPYSGNVTEAADAVLQNKTPVLFSLIDGHCVYGALPLQ